MPEELNSLNTSTPPPGTVFKRRPRYRGTHPRQFQEKYKEQNPAKYAETVQKVLAAGKTPAGMHRPICSREILEILDPQPGQIAVDATLGYGGHAQEILRRIQPGGRLIGLDVDAAELARTEARLRAQPWPESSLIVKHSNFAGLSRILPVLELPGADLILADLGCSSMQLDNPERGFSYKLDGPLDLRMNPAKGRPAADWLAAVSLDELVRVLEDNADEPQANRIAQAIIAARERQAIRRTAELSQVVRTALLSSAHGSLRPPAIANVKSKIQKPNSTTDLDFPEVKRCLARVFQAIRIEVNEEWAALETFLRFLPFCLNPGGKVAILSFHSGEDRRVKKAFQAGWHEGLYDAIAREVIRPSAEEVHANPRAASAKLRWAKRIA
jgi:16S rRNA (cytosine1402-N4)-methyltransferase